MQFSWLVFVLVVVANAFCIAGMRLAQASDKGLPQRNSLIPGTRQKFLYIQDFWTMTYGDWFGIPLIVNAYAHLMVRDIYNLWWGLPIMVVGLVLFARMCLGKTHKPDYGFPDIGKISLAGILHLIYFGVGIAAALMSAWGIWQGTLRGPVKWAAMAGGAFYGLCITLEFGSGNFNPLKRDEVKKRQPSKTPKGDGHATNCTAVFRGDWQYHAAGAGTHVFPRSWGPHTVSGLLRSGKVHDRNRRLRWSARARSLHEHTRACELAQSHKGKQEPDGEVEV